MISLLGLLLVLFIIALPTGLLFFRLFKRAKQKKAFKGAVFWLTSFWLCVIFVVIGLGWGLATGFILKFEKTYNEIKQLEP